MTFGDGVVEQYGRAVQPLGVVEFREVEMQPRPLVLRRQAVSRERIHDAILVSCR